VGKKKFILGFDFDDMDMKRKLHHIIMHDTVPQATIICSSEIYEKYRSFVLTDP
jgi:hypothetical protein